MKIVLQIAFRFLSHWKKIQIALKFPFRNKNMDSYALYHPKKSLHIVLKILFISRQKFSAYRMKSWLHIALKIRLKSSRKMLFHVHEQFDYYRKNNYPYIDNFASNLLENVALYRTKNLLHITRTTRLISIISIQIAQKIASYRTINSL